VARVRDTEGDGTNRTSPEAAEHDSQPDGRSGEEWVVGVRDLCRENDFATHGSSQRADSDPLPDSATTFRNAAGSTRCWVDPSPIATQRARRIDARRVARGEVGG
jgi:hypothetical protein